MDNHLLRRNQSERDVTQLTKISSKLSNRFLSTVRTLTSFKSIDFKNDFDHTLNKTNEIGRFRQHSSVTENSLISMQMKANYLTPVTRKLESELRIDSIDNYEGKILRYSGLEDGQDLDMREAEDARTAISKRAHFSKLLLPLRTPRQQSKEYSSSKFLKTAVSTPARKSQDISNNSTRTGSILRVKNLRRHYIEFIDTTKNQNTDVTEQKTTRCNKSELKDAVFYEKNVNLHERGNATESANLNGDNCENENVSITNISALEEELKDLIDMKGSKLDGVLTPGPNNFERNSDMTLKLRDRVISPISSAKNGAFSNSDAFWNENSMEENNVLLKYLPKSNQSFDLIELHSRNVQSNFKNFITSTAKNQEVIFEDSKEENSQKMDNERQFKKKQTIKSRGDTSYLRDSMAPKTSNASRNKPVLTKLNSINSVTSTSPLKPPSVMNIGMRNQDKILDDSFETSFDLFVAEKITPHKQKKLFPEPSNGVILTPNTPRMQLDNLDGSNEVQRSINQISHLNTGPAEISISRFKQPKRNIDSDNASDASNKDMRSKKRRRSNRNLPDSIGLMIKDKVFRMFEDIVKGFGEPEAKPNTKLKVDQLQLRRQSTFNNPLSKVSEGNQVARMLRSKLATLQIKQINFEEFTKRLEVENKHNDQVKILEQSLGISVNKSSNFMPLKTCRLVRDEEKASMMQNMKHFIKDQIKVKITASLGVLKKKILIKNYITGFKTVFIDSVLNSVASYIIFSTYARLNHTQAFPLGAESHDHLMTKYFNTTNDMRDMKALADFLNMNEEEMLGNECTNLLENFSIIHGPINNPNVVENYMKGKRRGAVVNMSKIPMDDAFINRFILIDSERVENGDEEELLDLVKEECRREEFKENNNNFFNPSARSNNSFH